MAELVFYVLSMVLNIGGGFAIVLFDERRLARTDPAALARAWPPASRASAIVLFAPLSLVVHFWRTRRSFVGVLLGVAAVAVMLGASVALGEVIELLVPPEWHPTQVRMGGSFDLIELDLAACWAGPWQAARRARRDPTSCVLASRAVGTVAAIGAAFLGIAATAGGMGVLFGRIVARLFPPRIDGAELMRNLYKMAVKSLPIVVVTALFTGAIMVIQAAPIVKRYGAEGLLGWGAGLGTLREIAPLLTALMISGRVGANNTAELGTMVVTEQVDALRALAIDPITFLILPRFLSIVATLFMMTLYADALALLGAAYSGQALLGVSPVSFYHGLTGGLLGFADVANGLTKSLVFGLVIALSSCHFGLSTSGGAPGVGRSVNAAVVASAAGVFVLDYLVSFALG